MDSKAFALGRLQESIAGDVIVPESPRFDAARRSVMSRFDDALPLAVVKCKAVGDVVETVKFSRQNGVAPFIRSGGHCFAGFSVGPGLVIDVAPLNSVEVKGDCALIGSGASLGQINQDLYKHGRLLPGGSCPTVGIAGSALGGGFGILGRLYGLTSDHMVAAEVVLSDGSVVACDAHHHADLYWALRGAGAGNFGVVTAFTFRTQPAAEMTSFYLTWSFDHAKKALTAWQSWVVGTPDEMAAGLAFTSTDTLDSPAIVELWGAMREGRRNTELILDHLIARIGATPMVETVKTMPYDQTSLYQAGILDLTQTSVATANEAGLLERQGYRASKSEFFDRIIPEQGVEALVVNFTHLRQEGQYRGIEFAPFGGAYNRVPRDATPFVHRNALCSIKHTMLLRFNSSAAEKAAANAWVDASWRSLRPWGTGGVYPNFPDLELKHAQQAYYGSNYPRLRMVKRMYDPGELFKFAQSIEL